MKFSSLKQIRTCRDGALPYSLGFLALNLCVMSPARTRLSTEHKLNSDKCNCVACTSAALYNLGKASLHNLQKLPLS